MLWLSLVPAIITIVITFRTHKLIPALLAGVFAGGLLAASSPFAALTVVGDLITEVLADRESAYTLGFLVMFGAFAELVEMAGGIAGFSDRVGKHITSERKVLLWSWGLSVPTFFDSSFHIIAVGTVLGPLVEKVKASKERFAFILSVTSLQLVILIPIATAYLGYMVTLVANNIRGRGVPLSPYAIVARSVLWNFFSWAMILIALALTFLSLGFGRLRIGQPPADEGLTEPHLEKEEKKQERVLEYPENATNLMLPVIVLIGTTLFLFWWTGRHRAPTILGALSNADFSQAIFGGAFLTIILTAVFFLFQRISLGEIEAHIIEGGEKVFSLVLILILSWALTGITERLGFEQLVGEGMVRNMPSFMLPAAVFVLSGLISYTLGSSWATWALMMPVAITTAVSAGLSIPLMVGTVWAGGAVTDVASPLSSQMAGTSFGEHLSTALPYTLVGAGVAILGYIIAGLVL